MKLRKMYEMNTTLVDGELLGDMPVLPLRNAVLYPGSLMPLSVGRPKSLTMFSQVEAGSVIIVVTQHDAGIEKPTEDEFFKVGTAARILEVYEDEDEILQVVVQGMERVVITSITGSDPFFTAQVELSAVPNDFSVEVVALSHSLSQLANDYIEMISKFPVSAFDLLNFAD